jgi:hypothetical protein
MASPRSISSLILTLLLGAGTSPLARGQDGGGPVGDGAGGYWTTVDLPVGRVVELDSGQVADTVPDEGAAVPFLRGPGEAFQGNVLVWPLEPPRHGPTVAVGIAAATEGAGSPYWKGLQEGHELLWRSGDAWGYLRLLEYGREGARLELARAAPGDQLLARRPARLLVEDTGTAFHLNFDVGDTAGPWRIERRLVAPGEEFVPVAIVDAPPFVDAEAPRGRLCEWRVSQADVAAPFGALARGLRGGQPGEWPELLQQGLRIDLVTGATGTETAHIEVTQLNPPNVVLRPLRETLLDATARPGLWQLPDRAAFDPLYRDKLRAFLAGGELAALTPEGVIVRLELLRQDDGGLVLRRYPALDGERIAPRPPEGVRFQLVPGNLAVHAAALDATVPRPEGVALVVERELQPGGGDWAVLAEGAPGERALSVPLAVVLSRGASRGEDARAPGGPTDPTPTSTEAFADLPLARLRVRQRYVPGPSSFPSPPLSVVLFDPTDGDARDRVLSRALHALDAPEWESRDQAARVVEALGEAAWPALERLLVEGSDAQRVVARELLAEGGGLARLFAAEASLAGVTTAVPEGLVAPRSVAPRAHVGVDPRRSRAQRRVRATRRGVHVGAPRGTLRPRRRCPRLRGHARRAGRGRARRVGAGSRSGPRNGPRNGPFRRPPIRRDRRSRRPAAHRPDAARRALEPPAAADRVERHQRVAPRRTRAPGLELEAPRVRSPCARPGRWSARSFASASRACLASLDGRAHALPGVRPSRPRTSCCGSSSGMLRTRDTRLLDAARALFGDGPSVRGLGGSCWRVSASRPQRAVRGRARAAQRERARGARCSRWGRGRREPDLRRTSRPCAARAAPAPGGPTWTSCCPPGTTRPARAAAMGQMHGPRRARPAARRERSANRART